MIMEKFVELRKIKSKMQFLDNCIEETRNRMKVRAMQYSDMPKIVGYKDKTMEILMEKLEELETKKNKLQLKFEMIQEELSILPEMPYKVAFYKVVYRMSWCQISSKLGYSRASCFRFFDEVKNFTC